MKELQIQTLNEVLEGELAVRGNWLVANVATKMSWPVNAQRIKFHDIDVWIIPLTLDHYPAIATVKPTQIARADCEKIMMRFLSALCWVESAGAMVDGIGGGNLPRPMGRQKEFGYSIRDSFELDYFPMPKGEREQLALALMREGRGLNHPAYAFLSFYRIFDAAVPGKKRGEWIERRLDKIRDHRAQEIIDKLRKDSVDIGKHIRESGRNAIAHAGSDPTINPDNPDDTRRLWSELSLMESIAELVIEDVYGIQTAHTVWQEHLYELDGFKEILGPQLVRKTIRGEQIEDGVLVDIPIMSVQLAGHPPYSPLSELSPVFVGQEGEYIRLVLQTPDQNFGIQLLLDFRNERLHFDINRDVFTNDDGTPECAEGISEIERFTRDYWCNGRLKILNDETGEIISRKDAFIPTNCYLDHEAAEKRIVHWADLANRRASKA